MHRDAAKTERIYTENMLLRQAAFALNVITEKKLVDEVLLILLHQR